MDGTNFYRLVDVANYIGLENSVRKVRRHCVIGRVASSRDLNVTGNGLYVDAEMIWWLCSNFNCDNLDAVLHLKKKLQDIEERKCTFVTMTVDMRPFVKILMPGRVVISGDEVATLLNFANVHSVLENLPEECKMTFRQVREILEQTNEFIESDVPDHVQPDTVFIDQRGVDILLMKCSKSNMNRYPFLELNLSRYSLATRNIQSSELSKLVSSKDFQIDVLTDETQYLRNTIKNLLEADSASGRLMQFEHTIRELKCHAMRGHLSFPKRDTRILCYYCEIFVLNSNWQSHSMSQSHLRRVYQQMKRERSIEQSSTKSNRSDRYYIDFQNQ